MTRVALLLQANSNKVSSQVALRPVVDTLGRVKKMVHIETPIPDDVFKTVGVMLRIMDSSDGKKKLLQAERRMFCRTLDYGWSGA
jgi:hypothetical protein